MALILGKPIVSRLETLQYANERFNWSDKVIIGIGHQHAFWAWLLARLTRRKCIYYCIDFYSPEIAQNLWDKLFIWSAMQMDKFLVRHCDEIWDISERINTGRAKWGHYSPPEAQIAKLVSLSYPPPYFRSNSPSEPKKGVFLGLSPYGFEILGDISFEWFGKGKMPINELLDKLSTYGFGISLWKDFGNNYYGDPGKTKLYSACGLPVIMTANTPYAEIIKKTGAGLVIDYNKKSVNWAVKEILGLYDYYKGNVKKTWEYIDADKIFGSVSLLDC